MKLTLKWTSCRHLPPPTPTHDADAKQNIGQRDGIDAQDVDITIVIDCRRWMKEHL
jgi:hypothetical protein